MIAFYGSHAIPPTSRLPGALGNDGYKCLSKGVLIFEIIKLDLVLFSYAYTQPWVRRLWICLKQKTHFRFDPDRKPTAHTYHVIITNCIHKLNLFAMPPVRKMEVV